VLHTTIFPPVAIRLAPGCAALTGSMQEAVIITGIQFRVGASVGQSGFAGSDGMLCQVAAEIENFSTLCAP